MKASKINEKGIVSIIVLGVSLLSVLAAVGSVYAREALDIQEKLRIPDSNYVQVIKTYSGATVIGRIVEIDSLRVGFVTNMGKLTIAISDIHSVEEIPLDTLMPVDTTLKYERDWFPNPNATRLFFSPTGRMQRKGEGYFADYYVLFPMVAYGVTDWFGIGGGFTLIPLIGIQNQVFYIMPRFGFAPSEKFSWSAGILAAKLPSEIDIIGAGIIYTTATYGTLDASFTGGVGYGFVWERVWNYYYDGTVSHEFNGMRLPMFMVGGEARLGKRISFVSENWIIPELYENPPVILSYGVRFFGEKISVDLGFINPVFTFSYGEGIFPGIPYVDFVYNF